MDVDPTEADNGVELSEQETELYDRQIRLWGLESQKRLRTAKVLVSGLCGLGAETTKNIILSGVNSVKLHDNKIATEEDFCSQFLIPRSSLGANRAESSISRAKELNPMVEISVDSEPLEQKEAEFFKDFDVVIIIGATNKELLRIDAICRENGVKFFAGDVWGMFGFCFADLQNHIFVEDTVKHKVISKPNEKTKTELITSTVQRELKFPPYSVVPNVDIKSANYLKKIKRTGPALVLLRILQEFRERFNRDPSYKSKGADILELEKIGTELTEGAIVPRDYFENVFGQISPAAAVVGGVLAQEVIKVVSKKEAPHCNVFLFDPETCCGFVETIGVEN